MKLVFSASNYLSIFIITCFISFTEAAQVNDISFSVIKTAESSGTLEALVVDGGSFFTFRKLVHNAVLVKHPKGDFLWDSGIGREVTDQMSVLSFLEKQLFSIENIKPARDQLDESGYPIDQLMAIIPSHMHWDHASGIEDFLGVPVWIQQESYDEAIAGQPSSFLQSQYDDKSINWQILTMSDQVYQGFSKSLDIYGDGTAVLVDLSGHTHGGQIGLVSLGLDWTVLAMSKGRFPDHGLFARGASRLYVHRGTGFYGFPLRLGVPGEASLLELIR